MGAITATGRVLAADIKAMRPVMAGPGETRLFLRTLAIAPSQDGGWDMAATNGYQLVVLGQPRPPDDYAMLDHGNIALLLNALNTQNTVRVDLDIAGHAWKATEQGSQDLFAPSRERQLGAGRLVGRSYVENIKALFAPDGHEPVVSFSVAGVNLPELAPEARTQAQQRRTEVHIRLSAEGRVKAVSGHLAKDDKASVFRPSVLDGDELAEISEGDFGVILNMRYLAVAMGLGAARMHVHELESSTERRVGFPPLARKVQWQAGRFSGLVMGMV